MGTGSIQLARLFGIRIGASPSWFFVLFIMIYGLSNYFRDVLVSSSSSTAYAVAVLGAVLFFVSLVMHELGHALVARRNGIGIAGIDLWFFGGIAKLSRDSRTPGEEFRVAAAGPAVTAALVLLSLAAATLASRTRGFLDSAALTQTATTPALALLGWLATVNLFLLVFNLVPAFPLDGGRIARAIAWRVTGDRNRGTLLSARLGQGFSYLLIGFGIYLLLRGDAFNGLWFIVLGWFLGQGARGAVASSRFSERLDGLTAGDLMDTQPVSIPADVPVLRAQDEWFLRYRWPWFPVVDAHGRFLGLVREERLERAMASGQPALAVGELLDPGAEDELRVQDDTPVESLLGADGLRTHGALMVVDGEQRLRGVVTAEQVRRALAAAASGRLP
jgi:Zn-dependent protease/CBS domain-containing protein